LKSAEYRFRLLVIQVRPSQERTELKPLSEFAVPPHFKPSFVEALGAALAAYPEARVEIEDKGITLHPARPPIARLAVG
jgi:hypothetical protein